MDCSKALLEALSMLLTQHAAQPDACQMLPLFHASQMVLMMMLSLPLSSSSSCGLTAALCGKNRYPRPLTRGTDKGTAPLWRAAHVSIRSPERNCAFPLVNPAWTSAGAPCMGKRVCTLSGQKAQHNHSGQGLLSPPD